MEMSFQILATMKLNIQPSDNWANIAVHSTNRKLCLPFNVSEEDRLVEENRYSVLHYEYLIFSLVTSTFAFIQDRL
ncbi:hypothetical protein SPOG_05399 [Schizosaccharomyces cryophilus OY26]|uniref:Uncharacterized protein n=1 Tax=Schizosaccharomyces cryophilus (strain OY26 / ATCC MYA-4695 / CBS 11777 / NBRC 106824 / NRRL Y48691) TaxID=653667 RepID=S9W824_SCHCR|nr:uncharacterized protein SPOG_05399 [Schizosaccharomyces cryophilus OY26]EPY53855.1 hypothetical protein SPOG_05399 [Schizosaccharomyces cryophilus OY26]